MRNGSACASNSNAPDRRTITRTHAMALILGRRRRNQELTDECLMAFDCTSAIATLWTPEVLAAAVFLNAW